MQLRRTASLALFGLALAVVSVACGSGGDPKREYEQGSAAVIVPVGQELDRLNVATSDRSRIAEAAAEIARAEDVFWSMSEQLEDLHPPDDARRLHDNLGVIARTYARQLARLRPVAERRDYDALVEAESASDDTIPALYAMIRALRRKGYDVPTP